MRYLVIGSGGREHTIYWRLVNDGSASEVFILPGNGGIEDKYRINVSQSDFNAIERVCIDKKIDMVVVGPEAPLVDGMVDFFTEKKIPAFGPSKEAAMLEGSKLFAKKIMTKYGVPTAGHVEFTGKDEILKYINGIKDYPVVIKLDGLAAGKGVAIPESKEEAIEFVNSKVKDNTKVFIEEHISGEEASVLGISGGEVVVPFVAAQDHKRIFDDDKGPNTGGMGAYAPAPVVDEKRLKRVCDEVLVPTVQGMKKEGIPFKGILYAGLIINGDNMSVLEFNARFGDPEAQVIIPLLDVKLGDIMAASINGTLNNTKMSFKDKSAVTVVMSSGGYPDSYENGKLISGLDSVSDDLIVFHAGTSRKDGKFYTNGGRVLNITALGADFHEAREKVYSEIYKISFDGAHYRKDIGNRALKYFGK